MAMKASCVNVLNKTVSTVCKLENQILSNTDNISFLNKYLNFNKNLLLSIMGNNIEMNVDMVHYSLDPSFIKNKQLKLFILGILKYLNINTKENYYVFIDSVNDIPQFLRTFKIIVPSIIQFSFIDSDKSSLVTLLDNLKTGNMTKISPIIECLNSSYGNVSSYTAAILYYLSTSLEINYFKDSIVTINGTTINKLYEYLLEQKKSISTTIPTLFIKYFEVTSILDTVRNTIASGTEKALREYKNKSVNDPYLPKPSNDNFIQTAWGLFLDENNLVMDYNGGLRIKNNKEINYAEPFEPFGPFEPSDIITDNYFTKITDYTATESQFTVENKIKELLDLTETETENE